MLNYIPLHFRLPEVFFFAVSCCNHNGLVWRILCFSYPLLIRILLPWISSVLKLQRQMWFKVNRNASFFALWGWKSVLQLGTATATAPTTIGNKKKLRIFSSEIAKYIWKVQNWIEPDCRSEEYKNKRNERKKQSHQLRGPLVANDRNTFMENWIQFTTD